MNISSVYEQINYSILVNPKAGKGGTILGLWSFRFYSSKQNKMFRYPHNILEFKTLMLNIFTDNWLIRNGNELILSLPV